SASRRGRIPECRTADRRYLGVRSHRSGAGAPAPSQRSRGDQRRVGVFLDGPLLHRSILLSPDEAAPFAPDEPALAQPVVGPAVNEMAEVGRDVLLETPGGRDGPLGTTPGGGDVPTLEVAEDG